MMRMTYAQTAYTHAMVNTSTTPLDLIILLYDGAIDYANKAAFYMNNNDIQKKLYYMSKTMAIVEELLSSLNTEAGGEVAENLQYLYVHMLKELAIANAKNDIFKVRHVEALLKELRNAWRQIR